MVTPAKRPKGLICPNCAVRLRTLETRPRSDGSVRRVKGCRFCGHKTQTIERPAGRQERP